MGEVNRASARSAGTRGMSTWFFPPFAVPIELVLLILGYAALS